MLQFGEPQSIKYKMLTALSPDLARRPSSNPNAWLKVQKNICIPAIWNRNSSFLINCTSSRKNLVLCCSARRQSICRAHQTEKDSKNLTGKLPKDVSDDEKSDNWSDQMDEVALSEHTSLDWGWLPAFPHVLTISIANFLFGYHIGAQANFVNEMILGRFLVGLGIGVNTVLVPVYISEVSPTNYRGSLGTMCQLGTCLGFIVALVLGIRCEIDPHWWRAMLCIASIPGFLLIVGMQFVAESPRWLGKVGRWDEAKTVASHLWGECQASSVIEEIKHANNMAGNDEEAGWLELFTKRHYKAPAIGGALFIFQQFAGINAVLYFSSLTFGDAGVDNSMVASIVVGVANIVGASTAFYLMDKQGRCSLLVGSYIGMAISMLLLVISLGAPIDEQMAHLLSILGTLMYVFTFSLGAGPVTGLIIPELSSTRTRAKTMAFSLCVHWVSNFVIGLFFLDMVEKFGLPLVYASFGTVSLLAAAFTNYYVPETQGRSLEVIQMLLNPDLE